MYTHPSVKRKTVSDRASRDVRYQVPAENPVEMGDWIDAADNYLRLHAGTKVHFHRGTMKQAEDALVPSRFVRIHRSAIAAVDRIASGLAVNHLQSI